MKESDIHDDANHNSLDEDEDTLGRNERDLEGIFKDDNFDSDLDEYEKEQ